MLFKSQYRTLEILNIITSLISLMGILCVLALMISVGVFGYKKKRIEIFHTISFNKLSFYIISFIFLSDTFRMIGHLLPTPSSPLQLFYSELSCRPGAFFKLFGSISTFLWMNITSYIVYKLLLYPHKFDKFYVGRIKRIFHCMSWPIALLISVIPLALSQYTMARSDGPWCFIDTHSTSGMTIAFFCYYLWLIVCWLIIILVYIAIGKLLANDYKKAKQYNTDTININNHNNIITKVPTIQRLQYFPLIFIFCWFWEILSISYNHWSSNNLFIIKILQICFTNLYGLFNACLFFYVIRNYSSNHVSHRNPKTIGQKKKKTTKKTKKKNRSTSKRKNKVTKQNTPNTCTEEECGVTLTVTTTNLHHIIIKSNKKGDENVDDISGNTVSLGVGNISVMSPTSQSTRDRIANGNVNSNEEDLEEKNLIRLSDDEDDDDDDNGYGYEITDDIGQYHNVTIGYNEDESDDFYSGEDTKSDKFGNIGLIEEDTSDIDQRDRSPKVTDNMKTDRGGFSLLRNESNLMSGDIKLELQYPFNQDNDTTCLHVINDTNDAYI